MMKAFIIPPFHSVNCERHNFVFAFYTVQFFCYSLFIIDGNSPDDALLIIILLRSLTSTTYYFRVTSAVVEIYNYKL